MRTEVYSRPCASTVTAVGKIECAACRSASTKDPPCLLTVTQRGLWRNQSSTSQAKESKNTCKKQALTDLPYTLPSNPTMEAPKLHPRRRHIPTGVRGSIVDWSSATRSIGRLSTPFYLVAIYCCSRTNAIFTLSNAALRCYLAGARSAKR